MTIPSELIELAGRKHSYGTRFDLCNEEGVVFRTEYSLGFPRPPSLHKLAQESIAYADKMLEVLHKISPKPTNDVSELSDVVIS